MTRVGKIMLFAALAAFATLVIGGAPAFAHDFHPIHHDDPATLHRDCTWSVAKSASTTSLTLAVGQVSAPVTYTITVSASCTDTHHEDGDHHAHDPAVDGHVLHPEHTPNHGTDLCVAVSDPNAPGPLFGDGQVCESELVNGSISTTYTRTFGPFQTCGAFTDTNTVTVSDLVHGTVLAQASATVHINVPCVTGCTLTQGYWKTHSIKGPAPFDDNWNNIPTAPYAPDDGDAVDENESETFFLSGKTWYQVFWTAPAGNAYYQLAHQYMAAVLNTLNGASVPAAVTTALNTSLARFQTYTPAYIGGLKGSNALRQEFISLAGTLGSYNQGTIAGGPPHCDE